MVTSEIRSISGCFLGMEGGRPRDTAPRVTVATAQDTEYTALAALQGTLLHTVTLDTLLDTALRDTRLEVDTAPGNRGLERDTVPQGLLLDTRQERGRTAMVATGRSQDMVAAGAQLAMDIEGCHTNKLGFTDPTHYCNVFFFLNKLDEVNPLVIGPCLDNSTSLQNPSLY